MRRRPPGLSRRRCAIAKGGAGFFEASVTVASPAPMVGIPIKIAVARGEKMTAEVFGATGFPIRLPLRERDAAWTTLLGHRDRTPERAMQAERRRRLCPAKRRCGNWAGSDAETPARPPKFAARKAVPLTIGLTPEQERDAEIAEPAHALLAFYKAHGRTATMGTVGPGGIVESLQPLKSPHGFPQWKTVASDLVLFGNPSTNVLLLDQLRAEIFPPGFRSPPPQYRDRPLHTLPICG